MIGGPGASTYVIAEAGVNHNGDVENALALVDAAASTGANAIKFQAFRAAALVTADAASAAYQRERAQSDTQFEMLRKLELSPGAFAAIARRCREVGIEFLATPFGIDDLHMLVRLGVAAIKIASPDVINLPLLAAAARTRLPLILSTGAAEPEEVDAAVDWLDRYGARDRLVLMLCVSSYPTRDCDANLRRIATMARRYRRPIGFSDHTQSTEIGALAVAAGAVAVEKHFTLDRRQPGPDQSFSLEPASLAGFTAAIRRAEAMLGRGELGVLNAEREVRTLSRCSVVSAGPIVRGERIHAGQLTVKRPGTGIAPAQLNRLVGRIAIVDIPVDTLLRWEMVR